MLEMQAYVGACPIIWPDISLSALEKRKVIYG